MKDTFSKPTFLSFDFADAPVIALTISRKPSSGEMAEGDQTRHQVCHRHSCKRDQCKHLLQESLGRCSHSAEIGHRQSKADAGQVISGTFHKKYHSRRTHWPVHVCSLQCTGKWNFIREYHSGWWVIFRNYVLSNFHKLKENYLQISFIS